MNSSAVRRYASNVYSIMTIAAIEEYSSSSFIYELETRMATLEVRNTH